MRQLAHENACFTIAAREVMSADRISPDAPGAGEHADRWHGDGGSAIYAPNATALVQASSDEECVISAELDFSMIDFVKSHIDNFGHYARPDVFQLLWNDEPKSATLHGKAGHGEDDD